MDAAWPLMTLLQKSPRATGCAPRLEGGDTDLSSELQGCQTAEPPLAPGWGEGRSFLLQAWGGGLCMEGNADPPLPLWASDLAWLGLRVPTCKVGTRTAHVPWGMTRGT